MSVENSDLGPSSDPDAKPMNGERMNGISNGHSGGDSKHHKSSSSSSSHRHKSSGKDKHRDREHKSSNHSSSKHSSSSSSHKDKDRHHHSSSSSSHKSSSRDKDRDRHRDKDKKEHSSIDSSQLMPPPSDTKSSGDKHREHKSSKDHKSSSHDKDRSDKSSSSSSSSKDKDKDKDRHRSSSSSKHRHSSSSSSSKHKDSKNRDRERSDKDRSSSSSHSHRHHDSSSSSKSKHSNGERSTSDTVDHIKKENEANGSMNGVVHHNNSVINNYSDEDVNPNMRSPRKTEFLNISQNSSCDYSLSQFRDDEPPFVIKQEQMDDSENVDGESQDCTYNNHNMNEEESEEDIPLSKRKIKIESDDEDDIPLTERKKMKTEKKAKKKKHASSDEESDYDDKPKKKKMKKEKKHKIKSEPVTPIIKAELNTSTSPVKGRKKKEEESAEVWKWWEEEKREDGVKWNFLEHKGPVFAPDYEPLPDNVQFLYDGKPMKLSQNAEEIACFYAKMLDHEYTSKKVFNDNFFHDWRKSMTTSEREKIHRLEKCNFKQMHQYFTAMAERNRNRTKEEKAVIKAENERLVQEYGFCTIDGHKEKIGNFKIEPPGLFRGRGEHPKMGKVKLRVMPEDILINCSKDSKPPVPPPGHRWKEVRNDNTVTWLASWVENVQSQVKYIMLNPSSKLKGEKDWQKYETARRLHKHIKKIRNTYREEWKSREMRIRQRGVALYFIDKLALRAGNEKDEDQADTVGCCSLRFEHIQLHKNLNGKECVVIFDFLGKDSIRYYNEVEVEKRVFKNLELFCENKKEGDEIFDRLNTTVMNEHLRELMDGLTAKVFRTYNASYTLQCQLDEMTDPKVSIPEKLLAYNRANRAVAILCNHQRAVPKTHAKSMENLKEKIRVKREAIEEAEGELHDLEKRAKRGSVKERLTADKKRKQLERLNEQLKKLELQETDRDENKTIALGTSKLNYLDPRISVAWCKKYGVPIEKIYNKTQRDKFRWAIDMATESYRF